MCYWSIFEYTYPHHDCKFLSDKYLLICDYVANCKTMNDQWSCRGTPQIFHINVTVNMTEPKTKRNYSFLSLLQLFHWQRNGSQPFHFQSVICWAGDCLIFREVSLNMHKDAPKQLHIDNFRFSLFLILCKSVWTSMFEGAAWKLEALLSAVSWGVMMCHDVSWCVMMCHDVSWCVMMCHDVSCCRQRNIITKHRHT